MSTSQMRAVKPKNQRSKRALDKKAPKIHENTKTLLCMRGPTSSEIVNRALTDMFMLKKPNSVNFTKKNDIRPFEDETSLEFLCQKNDASLFAVGAHNKKRPHAITLGRMYDTHVLDMVEVSIENFLSMQDIKSTKASLGSKPCMLFQGDDFEHKEEYIKLKNIMIDVFRGHVIDHMNLAGMDRLMVFTQVGTKVLFRNYAIVLKKSGQKLPRVELEETGPAMDFVIKRTKFAAADVYKHAIKIPSGAKAKSIKNVSHNELLDKVGRVHMKRQNYETLGVHKFKSTGKRGRDGEDEGEGEGEGGGDEAPAAPAAASRRSTRARKGSDASA